MIGEPEAAPLDAAAVVLPLEVLVDAGALADDDELFDEPHAATRTVAPATAISADTFLMNVILVSSPLEEYRLAVSGRRLS